MNKIILILMTLMISNSYASNIVYKCISPDGEVSYLNVTKEKKGTCSNTQLGQINFVNVTKNLQATKNSNINNASYTPSNEQKERNEKRNNILSKELEEEKAQLNTLNTMLKNVAETDVAQITQIKDMQNIHNRNIATLEKELGINKNINIAIK